MSADWGAFMGGSYAGTDAARALAFVGHRSRNREVRCRTHGVSSDALALYGIGEGRRPQTPGRTNPGSRSSWSGAECGHDYPHDEGDLLACTLTYLMAPAAVRERMLPVLEEFQQWVWYGINRYGEKVADGYRKSGDTAKDDVA